MKKFILLSYLGILIICVQSIFSMKNPNHLAQNKREDNLGNIATIANNSLSTSLDEVSLKNYDRRCVDWFDPKFRKFKTPRELLYHSFPLGMDYLIKQYGNSENWINQTNPAQIDIRYYIGGEIQHGNGDKEVVVFTLTQDPTDIIYHRGIERNEPHLLRDFLESKLEFDFPSGFQQPNSELKNIMGNSKILTYRITPYYITLKDILNNVTIILFKSRSKLSKS